jgi:hypothetical protein
MDPNHIVEALKLILSGDNDQITRGESVMHQARSSDTFIKTLMIIANSQEVRIMDFLNFNFFKN